jgi:hypothetical protein
MPSRSWLRIQAKGEEDMPTKPFSALRGESTVPTVLTLLVSAWFLAASGAILADRVTVARAAPQAPAMVCSAPLPVVPDMHETITVEAQRG